MTIFVVNSFSSMIPMLSKRLLPQNSAQKAVNVRLTSGELSPLKSTLKVGNGLLSKVGVKKTIYKFSQSLSESQYWFHWTSDVNVVRGNVADDAAEKTYFTGDGAPKYTFSPAGITGGGTDYPYGAYLLGVIKPDLISTNTSVANRAITSITFIGTEATATTDFPHKLESNSTSQISGASEAVYNGSKKVTIVSDTVFKYTLDSAPVANASGTLSFNYGGLKENRIYAFTYVDASGAEGAPSILSGAVEVVTGQVVSFTGLPTAPVGNYNFTKKRIYRTVDGSANATLRYVGEVSLAVTTFTDDKLGTELGENIPSLTYEAPPSDMRGLIQFSNGMMAGISLNQVCISVAYRPHAYPIANRYSFNVDLVALGSFGNSIVVLTKGIPSILTGSSPESMTQDEVKYGQPCLSAKSVVEIAGGVMWASDEGLAFIGNGGFDLATKNKLSAKEWSLYNPSSIHAYRWENRYVGFYEVGGVQRGFVFDLTTADFYELDFYATAGFTDPKNGNLYLAIGDDVYKFDAGDSLTLYWKSKAFNTNKPINMSYAKVVAESYPITFNLYADGVLELTKNVNNELPFALPIGYKATQFEFDISSQYTVYGVAVAESMRELQAVVE